MRAFVFLLLTASALAQVPKPPWAGGSNKPAATPDSPAATFKVQVKLVSVFVSVTDERGAPIGGLTKDNFNLLEDGVAQNISVFDKESALPLSIVMDIDTSLSTRKDLPLELTSARRFVHDILRPVDALSLYEFSEVVDEVVPFTADLKTIDQGISHVHHGAATALYDALYLSSQTLERRQGRKVIVIVTDGGDTASQIDYQQAVRAVQEADAIVYSIIDVPIEASAGRDLGGEHALIQISADTGGRYFYATTVPQMDDAFRQISDELRTQYLLGYYPAHRLADSDFRRIQVKVISAPGSVNFRVRHRAGYYATKGR
ncbi:MAG: VWA domain-containing protein [Terriglobales bacterium]|jgi:Ca-activated chloride channel family protein